MKKRPPPKAVPTDVPTDLAARGREALGQGSFKTAVEAFKQLVRQDPRPEWRDALSDAYAGRARSLAEKGMFGEAATVLENTATADGAVREPRLYVSCLVRQNQLHKALCHCLKQSGNVTGPDAERLAVLAAALWLARTQPCAPPAGPLAAPLQAAEAGLAAWSGGRPEEEVEALLAAVPFRSPAGPVRVVLKALLSHDPEKVPRLLGMIPTDSPFAGLGRAAAAALADGDALIGTWQRLTPAERAFVAEVRGIPAASGQFFRELDEAGRGGPAAMLTVLARHRAVLPAAEARRACLDLLVRAPDRLSRFEKSFGPLPASEKHRIQALAAEAGERWVAAEAHWNSAATHLAKEDGPDAGMATAVIWRHLADLGLKVQEIEGDGTDPVAYYLDRSVEADPDFLDGVVRLLARYRDMGRTADWRERVEWAIKRFPREPAILGQAMEAAVASEAYKKASKFARTLLDLDPINQPVRTRMIELQLAHARKQLRGKRADLAAKDLTAAAEWERVDAPSGPLRIGQGLAGLRLGRGAEAEARLREGVALCGAPAVGWLRAMREVLLTGGRTADRDVAALVARELAAAQRGEVTREAILETVAILNHPETRDNAKIGPKLMGMLHMWLAKGDSFPWTTAEMTAIADILWHYEGYALLGAYAKRAADRAPEEPVHRFHVLVAKGAGVPSRLPNRERDELEDLAAAAEERGDFHTARRIDRFLYGDDADDGSFLLPPPRERPGGAPAGAHEALDDLLGALSPEMVRRMVTELGRDGAVAELVTLLRGSPLGDIIPPSVARTICAKLVQEALRTPSKPKGRR